MQGIRNLVTDGQVQLIIRNLIALEPRLDNPIHAQ